MKEKKPVLRLREFCNKMRPIAISLSPNTETKDVWEAVKLFFSPSLYFKDNYAVELENWFQTFFKTKTAVSFSSGRSAFYALLKAHGVEKGDEVIIQAFTCSVVPYMILQTGALPVYADIDDSFTMDPKSLEEKITKKTKLIVVQHTFGIPAKIDEIIEISKNRSIPAVEDCAHGFGYSYKGKKLGEWATSAFFSFGRDKAFSSVFGGMAITNDTKVSKKLTEFQKTLKSPSFFWTMQQLFHPIAFFVILPSYSCLSIGKLLLVFLQKASLLSLPVSKEEKNGTTHYLFIKKMPNQLARLAILQLRRFSEFNKKRIEMVHFYVSELKKTAVTCPLGIERVPLLRFPITTEKRDLVFNTFLKRGILLGKWYSEVIDPKGSDLDSFYYKKGMCPKAESLAKHILNLPTYPTLARKDLETIVLILKQCLKS